MPPEVGKVCMGLESGNKMDVALVRFTLIDEPDPPLTKQMALYHKFNMLNRSINRFCIFLFTTQKTLKKYIFHVSNQIPRLPFYKQRSLFNIF